MNKSEFLVTTHNGPIADRLQEPMREMYEAVYRKGKEKVELLFISILDDILKRYPNKSQPDDKTVTEDIRVLELFIADFDIDYADYLSEVKGIDSSGLWAEASSFAFGLISNPWGLSDLIACIIQYLQGGEQSSYSYDSLLRSLDEYKKNRVIKVLYEKSY